MIRERESVIRRVVLLMDGILVSLAYVLSYFLRHKLDGFSSLNLLVPFEAVRRSSASLNDYLVLLFLIVPFWCLILYLNGMYASLRTRTFWEIIWILIKSAILTYLVLGMFVFLFKISFMSRLFFILFVMFSLAFSLAEKTLIFFIMHSVRRSGRNQRRLLVVGTGRRAADFVHRIHNHREWGLKILGAIDDEPGRGVESVDGVKIIGDLKDIPRVLHDLVVDEVIFVVPRLRLNHIEDAIHDCEIEGVKVTIAVDLFDLKIAKSYQTELDGVPLLTFKTTVPNERDLFIKRIIDVAISGTAILILSPFLLVFSIIIKLSSRGPVFFKQERIGLSGRRFTLYKFRTMYVGAQEKLSQVDIYKEIYKPQWKQKKLQYVTPIGRILRKFSLDEFPQFFNVLWGHMSLVGPRPTLPQEVKQYEAWHRRRFSMRPGLTCLWQVKGRRKIEFHEWMQLDLEYLDNWSLWLDFKILAKTVPAVVFGMGAY